jgi:hypothetical protein
MRHLEVIYCDDVRHEVGNKQSLIGVYPGDLYLEALPAVLPKLCMVATLVIPAGECFESLRIKAMQDEHCLFESGDMPPPGDEVIQGASAGDDEGDEGPMMRLSLVLVLSPFQVDEEISLRVVAELDGRALSSRRLRIRRRPAA